MFVVKLHGRKRTNTGQSVDEVKCLYIRIRHKWICSGSTVLPSVRAITVAARSRMQSFILSGFFVSAEKDEWHTVRSAYIHAALRFPYSHHVLLIFLGQKKTCPLSRFHFCEFTCASRRQVMRQQVRGQARGPVEVKRRWRGRRPQRWVTHKQQRVRLADSQPPAWPSHVCNGQERISNPLPR